MSKVLIIGMSVDPDSKSQLLARVAVKVAKDLNLEPELLDLRELTLPFAGEAGSFDDALVEELKQKVSSFRKFLFCVPIYNYDVSASAKNFIELAGDSWLEDATVGFICAASGQSSYMSVMSFANSLMLDFRCWIVPRFVYAVKKDWEGNVLKEPKVIERIRGLLESLVSGPR
jgi:NAD(P)H-dependent FMN reductase